MKQKKIVIVGATSEIAKQCARLLVSEGPREMLLLGRDKEKLKSLAADLSVRNPQVLINYNVVSFTDPEEIAHLAERINETGVVDLVLIAQGMLSSQKECQEDLSACNNSLIINGISPVLFAEAFAKYMEKNNQGTLVLIGSVAGDRGRRSNYTYGAGKGFIERYVQGLQHRFANAPVHVLLVKPGPTDTPMTAHLKAEGKRLASSEKVAFSIIQGIGYKKKVIYVPGLWKYIMLIIKGLPDVIFSKLNL